jgi:L,D-peptidoglycan transpeptidase YkuD (ErfK/YbiS/YcfS/YnhG family)
MKMIARADGSFVYGEKTLRCALGRSGVIAAGAKREGDGASPLGRWPVRRALFRPDRIDRPHTALPLQAITPDDGWCDAPSDPAYNRPVRLPYPARHETMTREDGLYDLVVVVGHNDDPPVTGLGSAIFLHCAHPGFKPTEGCVALAREYLIALVEVLTPGDVLEIAP